MSDDSVVMRDAFERLEGWPTMTPREVFYKGWQACAAAKPVSADSVATPITYDQWSAIWDASLSITKGEWIDRVMKILATAKPVSVDAGGMTDRNSVIEECALAIQASNGECPCECAGRGCDCGNYGDAAEAASWAAGNAFAATVRKLKTDHCMCAACKDGVLHKSDCSVHNMPAYPNGPCDCGAALSATGGNPPTESTGEPTL